MQWTPDKVQRRTITVESSLGPNCSAILCPRYVHNLQRIHQALGEARVASTTRSGRSEEPDGSNKETAKESDANEVEWQHAEAAFDAGNGRDTLLASYRCQVTRVGHCRMEPAKAGSRKASQQVQVYEIYFDKELRWVHQDLLLFTEPLTLHKENAQTAAAAFVPQPILFPAPAAPQLVPLVAPVPIVPVPTFYVAGTTSTSNTPVVQCTFSAVKPNCPENRGQQQLGTAATAATVRCASSEPRETPKVPMLSLPLSTASSPTQSPSQLFPPVPFTRGAAGNVMVIPALQLPAVRPRESMPPPAHPPQHPSRDASGKPSNAPPTLKRPRSQDQEQDQEQALSGPLSDRSHYLSSRGRPWPAVLPPVSSTQQRTQRMWNLFPVFAEPATREHSAGCPSCTPGKEQDKESGAANAAEHLLAAQTSLQGPQPDKDQVLTVARLEAAVRIGHIVATCAEHGCHMEGKELISQSPLLVLYLHDLFPQCHRVVLQSLGAAVHAGPTQFASFIQRHLEDHFDASTVEILYHSVSYGVLVHSLSAQWKTHMQSRASVDAATVDAFRDTVALFERDFVALAPYIQPQWIAPIRQFLTQWRACLADGGTLAALETPFVCATLLFRPDLVPSCTRVPQQQQPQETKPTTSEDS